MDLICTYSVSLDFNSLVILKHCIGIKRNSFSFAADSFTFFFYNGLRLYELRYLNFRKLVRSWFSFTIWMLMSFFTEYFFFWKIIEWGRHICMQIIYCSEWFFSNNRFAKTLFHYSFLFNNYNLFNLLYLIALLLWMTH